MKTNRHAIRNSFGIGVCCFIAIVMQLVWHKIKHPVNSTLCTIIVRPAHRPDRPPPTALPRPSHGVPTAQLTCWMPQLPPSLRGAARLRDASSCLPTGPTCAPRRRR